MFDEYLTHDNAEQAAYDIARYHAARQRFTPTGTPAMVTPQEHAEFVRRWQAGRAARTERRRIEARQMNERAMLEYERMNDGR